jgi:1-phosphofructokinase family hexose kinase
MIFTVTLNPAIDRELTVPAIEFDSVLRATASRVDFGGKGFNVSRMLASLGAESVALGFAGGAAGELLRDGLESLGIATDFVQIAGETRTNISVVSAARDRSLKVNEAGPTVSAEEQAALLRQVRGSARAGDWWVLAGSLPPGVPAGFYADLIAAISGAGASVALDTSGAALRHGCAARPTLVKPNAVEASELGGRPVANKYEAIEAALALDGIPYVAVSLGADGALLAHEGKGWLAHPPAIRERSAIGAGDSMVAGMVWGLTKGGALEALRWGVACGAATASRDGTEVGSRDEVLRLAELVRIERLV